MIAKQPETVVIIGGGIIGLSSAYFAAQRGLNVTVIDRLPIGGDNCSRGNAGMIVPSHFIPLAAPGVISQGLKWLRDPESPFHVKPRLNWDLIQWGIRFYLAATKDQVNQAAPILRDLNLASRELYFQWSDTGIDCSLVKKGLLMLCRTEHALEEEISIANRAKDLGVPATILSAAETSAIDPNVTMSTIGSVYYPKDCHLDPSQLLVSLREKIITLGGRFIPSAHVSNWKTSGHRIVAIETPSEEITGDEFVLCGGIWSDGLVRQLGIRLPMQPGKGYSLSLPNPIELPSVCSIMCEAKVAVTPMGNSLRFGGTMQVGELNQTIDPRRVRGIIKSIPDYMPRFRPQHFEGIQPWCGLRPVSPDGLPYIGRPESWHNLTIATGHAMMGLSLGPITGQLVSQCLLREPTSIDISRISPNRYM